MFTDVTYKGGGGFFNWNTPVSEEYLRRPTPTVLYYGAEEARSGTLFIELELVFGKQNSN